MAHENETIFELVECFMSDQRVILRAVVMNAIEKRSRTECRSRMSTMRSARCWAAPAAKERISLKYNADGSLDIYMQKDSPGTDKQSNWLPIPSSGMFNLTVRSYQPGEALLDGSYKLPSVVKMQ